MADAHDRLNVLGAGRQHDEAGGLAVAGQAVHFVGSALGLATNDLRFSQRIHDGFDNSIGDHGCFPRED